MVLTGKSIDRKDKLTPIFSKREIKRALGACLTAAKEFHDGEEQEQGSGRVGHCPCAGWEWRAVSKRAGGEKRDQNPGGTSLTQDTPCKDFSVWVTHEVAVMGLRMKP